MSNRNILSVEVLEDRCCPSLPPGFVNPIEPPSNYNVLHAGNAPSDSGQQVQQPGPLFYLQQPDGTIVPKFDYSGMDLTNALNFAGFLLNNPAIAQALTPPANMGPVVAVVNNYDPAPQANPTLPPPPAPGPLFAAIPQDGTDALVASVAGFLTTGGRHDGS